MDREIIIVLVPPGIERLDDVFCGCGLPDLAWQAIKEELDRVSQEHAKRSYLKDAGEWYVVAYLLDHLGLTEHGGSVGAAWLTIEGERALAFLNQWGTSWHENNAVEFIDSKNCRLN